MTLRVEPSLVRVRDGDAGQLDITIDNRRGTRTRRVFLAGRDPERGVRFSFSPPSIDVLPARSAGPGCKVAGTGTAAGPGVAPARSPCVASSEGTGRPRGGGDLRPGDLRGAGRCAGDAAARSQCGPGPGHQGGPARGDHRQPRRQPGCAGSSSAGRDPERLVRFTFSPPSLDVLPGDIGRARVRLEAPLPEPGQEATRQVTVVAPDGGKEIEASGTFVQRHLTEAGGDAGGPQAGAQPVAGQGQPVRPVPGDRRQPAGHQAAPASPWPAPILNGRWDFRSGRRWWRSGTGRSPGQWPGRRLPTGARPGGHPAVLGVGVRRRQGGRDRRHLHPVHVSPATRRTDDHAAGPQRGTGAQQRFGVDASCTPTIAAASAPAAGAVRRSRSGAGGALRLRPSGAGPRAWADRRRQGATSPRPGRTAASRSTGRSPSSASDGARDTEASGNFVQESSDWRPLWRILLTVLGALLMIGGSFLVWNVGRHLPVPGRSSVSRSRRTSPGWNGVCPRWTWCRTSRARVHSRGCHCRPS